MESVSQKLDILYYQRQALFRESHFITDDLTLKDLQTKRRLKPVMDKARQEGKRWKFKNGKLIIEGQVYQEGNKAGRMHSMNPPPPPQQQSFAAVTSGVQMVQAPQRMPVPPTAAMRMPQPAHIHPQVPIVSNTGQHAVNQGQHITHRANHPDTGWPQLPSPSMVPQDLRMSYICQPKQADATPAVNTQLHDRTKTKCDAL